jgi:hypothetical protein
MDNQPTIVGAGLAGLIAAHAWPASQVLEAAPQPKASHKALLRFRSDAVARLVGIDFRKVKVHKGIWAEGAYQQSSIRWANLYAQKVLGAGQLKGDRSIWNLDSVERFIAPDDLYEQLVASVGDRIQWNTPTSFEETAGPVISTAPLPVMLESLGVIPPVAFSRSGITVRRWTVPGADVFQTVYFPDPELSVYRASITGDTLIVECVDESIWPFDNMDEWEIQKAFGIKMLDCQPLDKVDQKYGKIAPIDDAVRKQLLFKLTHENNIYSLGRFATWRNILLDDVVEDVAAIKKLLKANSAYDIRKAAA